MNITGKLSPGVEYIDMIGRVWVGDENSVPVRKEFIDRRQAKAEIGWDECSACGTDHTFRDKQDDGRYYCEYCGAEALPEVAAEMDAGQ